MKFGQYGNWLPGKSSLGGLTSFGLFRSLLVILFFLTLFLFVLPDNQKAKAQTAQATQTQISVAGPVVGILGGNTLSIRVDLSNFTDPNGLGAFGFKLGYNKNLVSITDLNSDGKADAGVITTGSFLGSTGKQVVCTDGFIDKNPASQTNNLLNYACGTVGPTPAGPTGSGTLATINFKTDNTLGTQILTLSNTQLATNSLNAILVPHTDVNLTVQIAKCGDFNGDKYVAIPDILILAQKFGLTSSSPNWDPKYDLDGNNAVTIADLFAAAREFGQRCP